MPISEALPAIGIGIASSPIGTGVGSIGTLGSFSPSISSEITSGLSGGSFSRGSISFTSLNRDFAAFDSLTAPSLDTRVSDFDLKAFKTEVKGQPPTAQARPSITAAPAPIFGEDASLKVADRIQLEEAERSFLDSGVSLSEARAVIQQTVVNADPRSPLSRHLEHVYKAQPTQPADVVSEQVIEAEVIQDAQPAELTPVIRPTEAITPFAFLNPLEDEEEKKRKKKQALAFRVEENVTQLQPQRELDRAKVLKQQRVVLALLERHNTIKTEHGLQIANEVIRPILGGLDIFIKTEADIVKDEEAASNRVREVKTTINETKPKEQVTGPELAGALVRSKSRIEGRLQPNGVDGSLIEAVAELLLLDEKQTGPSLERKALEILENNPPGEVSTGGRRLTSREVSNITNPSIIKVLAALGKRLVKFLGQDFTQQPA